MTKNSVALFARPPYSWPICQAVGVDYMSIEHTTQVGICKSYCFRYVAGVLVVRNRFISFVCSSSCVNILTLLILHSTQLVFLPVDYSRSFLYTHLFQKVISFYFGNNCVSFFVKFFNINIAVIKGCTFWTTV